MSRVSLKLRKPLPVPEGLQRTLESFAVGAYGLRLPSRGVAKYVLYKPEAMIFSVTVSFTLDVTNLITLAVAFWLALTRN